MIKRLLCRLGLHQYETQKDLTDTCTINITTTCKGCGVCHIPIEIPNNHTWVYDDTQATQASSSVSMFEITSCGIKCSGCEVKNRRLTVKTKSGAEFRIDGEME